MVAGSREVDEVIFTVNSTDTLNERWEVTTSADTLLGSFYFLVHRSSGKAVKVATSMRSRRRSYVWSSFARQNEGVPLSARREIDRAIVRYLSSDN